MWSNPFVPVPPVCARFPICRNVPGGIFVVLGRPERVLRPVGTYGNSPNQRAVA